jgi:hypothetical protein
MDRHDVKQNKRRIRERRERQAEENRKKAKI